MDVSRGRRFAVALVSLAGFVCSTTFVCPASAATIEVHPERIAVPAVSVSDQASTGAIDVARHRIAAGDLRGAVAGLSAYVDAHPGDAATAIFLGDLYLRSGDRAAAERAYRSAFVHGGESDEAHDRLGSLYLAKGRVGDAIVEFDQAAPLSRAYEHLVEAHRRLGDLRSYEEELRDAVFAAPFDSDALWAIGVVYEADRRPDAAVPYLKRAADLTHRSCAVLSMLGDAYLDEGQRVPAADAFNHCLSIEPNNYSALVDLSSVLIEGGGRGAEALALLGRARAADPDRPEAYINFGYIEDLAGRWENAVDFYRKALALDPLERAAFIDLGYDYLARGLYGSAEAVLVDGLAVLPNDGRLHYLLGLTYAQQGKRDLARSEFHEAMTTAEPEIVRAATAGLSNT
jgi:tetratricopeptide (TPR) repeat protein